MTPKPLPLPGTPFLRAVALALALCGFLVGMAAIQLYKRANGVEALLDAEPVDPRELFRGYYVRLGPKIARLNLTVLAAELPTFAVGDRIFVRLEPNADGVHEAKAVAADRPASDGLWIQGRVVYAYEQAGRYNDETGEWENLIEPERFVDVRYNLESYFADEAEAKRLETFLRDGSFRLIVSIGADGSAVIKGIEVEGAKTYDRLF